MAPITDWVVEMGRAFKLANVTARAELNRAIERYSIL